MYTIQIMIKRFTGEEDEWLKYEDQSVNVTLRWPTLWDAAAEADTTSSWWHHIQDSDLRGRDGSQ